MTTIAELQQQHQTLPKHTSIKSAGGYLGDEPSLSEGVPPDEKLQEGSVVLVEEEQKEQIAAATHDDDDIDPQERGVGGRDPVDINMIQVTTTVKGKDVYIPDVDSTSNTEDVGNLQDIDLKTQKLLLSWKQNQSNNLQQKLLSNRFSLPKPVSNKLYAYLLFGFMISCIFWLIGSAFLSISSGSFAAASALIAVSGFFVVFNYQNNIQPIFLKLSEIWRDDDVFMEEKLTNLLQTVSGFAKTILLLFWSLLIVALMLILCLPTLVEQENLWRDLSSMTPAMSAMFSLLIISATGSGIIIVFWLSSLLLFIDKANILMVEYLSTIINRLREKQQKELIAAMDNPNVNNVRIDKNQVRYLVKSTS